jgi:prepilin-type processing-associated H-X9-DG protein
MKSMTKTAAGPIATGSLDILFADGHIVLEDRDGNALDAYWFDEATELKAALDGAITTLHQWKTDFGRAIAPGVMPTRREVYDFIFSNFCSG